MTTAMVVAATAYLLDRVLGRQVEAKLYESVTSGQLRIEALTTEDWQRVYDLVLQYADMRLGGTDAGLIALAERHRQHRIATLNTRHFRAVRPRTPPRSPCFPPTFPSRPRCSVPGRSGWQLADSIR